MNTSFPIGSISGPVGELYVSEAHLNQVAVIDTASAEVIRCAPINDVSIMPLGSRPTVLVTTPDDDKIYSANFGLPPPTISATHRHTGEVKSIILFSAPLGIFMSVDGREIYIPGGNYSIEAVSTENDTIIHRLSLSDIAVGSICSPDGHLYDGYVSGNTGVHDAKTGEMLCLLIATGLKLPAWYTFSSSNQKLYSVD